MPGVNTHIENPYYAQTTKSQLKNKVNQYLDDINMNKRIKTRFANNLNMSAKKPIYEEFQIRQETIKK